jgi:methyltransferase family protein
VNPSTIPVCSGSAAFGAQAKSPYDDPKSVESFSRDFSYDRESLREAADRTADDLAGLSAPQVRVLDVGVGTGAFILPFLERLRERSLDCELDCLDISNLMLKRFQEHLNGSPLPNGAVRQTKADADKGLPQCFRLDGAAASGSDPRYDLVVITFVLHYLDNWRELIDRVYESLDFYGLFLQAEVIGDMRCVDGRPCPTAPREFQDFWSAYFEKRAERKQGVPWNPRIRVSDISAALDYCGRFEKWREEEYQWKQEVTWGRLCEWIEAAPVSSLSSDLDPEDRKFLADDMRNWLHDRDLEKEQPLTLNWGFRLVWLRKPFRPNELLWRSFDGFSRVPVPDAEGGQLPIEPAGEVEGNLREYLGKLLDDVLKPVFDRRCLFLDICLWDPFRQTTSQENWALSGHGISRVSDRLQTYTECTNSEARFNVFYLLYSLLRKKDVLRVTVYPDSRKPSTDPPLTGLVTPDQAAGVSPGALEALERCHQHFAVPEREVYIYYIPTDFHPQRGLGIGGLILISSVLLERNILNQLRAMLEATLSKVGLNYLFRNFWDKSLRAAVAAIMARNMSHNAGSHGLAHLIGGTISFDPEDPVSKAGQERAFLEYLKGRMDFVAEITTYWRELPWLEQPTS